MRISDSCHQRAWWNIVTLKCFTGENLITKYLSRCWEFFSRENWSFRFLLLVVTWLGYLSFFNIVKLAQRKNQTYTYTHMKHMPVTTLKSIHAQHPSIVFVNACVCRCVDTCEYICVEPWDSLDCHSSDVIYLFAILFYFRQCLSLDWNSSSRLCCLSEKPQDSAFRCLPSPETSGVSPHLDFFFLNVVTWRSNPGPQAHWSGT